MTGGSKYLAVASGTPTIMENQINAAGSAQITCPVYTVSNNGTNFTVAQNRGTGVPGIAIPAAGTADVALFTLPANGEIDELVQKSTTAWSGTGFISITSTIGDSAGGAMFYTSTTYSNTAAVSNTNFQGARSGFTAAGNNVPLLQTKDTYAGSTVNFHLIANQNLNANPLTGVTDVTVCWHTNP